MSDATNVRTTLTGIVVGTCPKDGCTGHLIAEVSDDRSCWERDRCERCDASWFNDPPRPLADLALFDAKATQRLQNGCNVSAVHIDWCQCDCCGHQDTRIRTLETDLANERAELLKQIEIRDARVRELEATNLPREPLACPKCNHWHVDGGEWATRPHHNHLCINCGHIWDVGHRSFGIAPDSVALERSPRTGGPEKCPRPCTECPDRDHHFSDAMVEFAANEPDHEAAKLGAIAWYVCKHCDAWRECTNAEADDEDLDLDGDDEMPPRGFQGALR